MRHLFILCLLGLWAAGPARAQRLAHKPQAVAHAKSKAQPPKPQPLVRPTAPVSSALRVWLRVVDSDGRPQGHAQVRVDGSPVALWADDAGCLSLLADLSHGPLHLRANSYGYEEAEQTIERPEDNNLVFQLFRPEAQR